MNQRGTGLVNSLAVHSAAFISGFVTMALEMVIGRTFTPYFGGTIYTWGALISVFLIGMTIGYTVGGRMADKYPSGKMVAYLFFLSTIPIVFLPLCGDAVINLIIDYIDDTRYAGLVAAVALACLPAALLAAVSPLCVRLLLHSKNNSGAVSGRLSALCTAGSIVGTLGTTFVLIPSIGIRSIFLLLAAVAFVWGLFALAAALQKRDLTAVQVAPSLLAIAFVCGSLFAPPAQAQQASLLMRADGVIDKVDSEYNSIIVEKSGSQVALNFGYRNSRYTESVIDLRHKDELVVTYTQYMTAGLVYSANPVRKIALVGLGGGRTISYLVDSLPAVVADVAELDPAVIDVAKKYFAVTPSDRLRINATDGRLFLTRSKDKYDLILLDAYRGPFVPFHLTTKEFYGIVKAHLVDGGVVAQNVEPSTMFFDSAYVTMKSAFDQVDAIEASGNIVLVGYNGKRFSDAELAERAARWQGVYKLRYDLKELVKARKPVTGTDTAKVLTDDFAPVENLKTIKRHNEKRE